MGDFGAAGIRHRKCRYATKQPGCTAERHRHLVLQRRWLALGEACLGRRYRARRSWHCPWKHDSSRKVTESFRKKGPPAQAGGVPPDMFRLLSLSMSLVLAGT